jgi:hypothetical protein
MAIGFLPILDIFLCSLPRNFSPGPPTNAAFAFGEVVRRGFFLVFAHAGGNAQAEPPLVLAA